MKLNKVWYIICESHQDTINRQGDRTGYVHLSVWVYRSYIVHYHTEPTLCITLHHYHADPWLCVCRFMGQKDFWAKGLYSAGNGRYINAGAFSLRLH